MIVSAKLTKEEYKSASFAIMWSRGTFKIIAIVYSLAMLLSIIASPIQAQSILSTSVPLIIMAGLMYFVFSWSMSRDYKHNPRVNENIEYQFDDSGITIKGETFKSTFTWGKMYKVTKTKKWLLLWHNSQIANAIRIDKISTDMLERLKTMVTEHKVKNNL